MKTLNQAEKHLHEHLLDVRKKAIAHSDFTKSSSRPFSYPGNGGVIMATKMYDPLTEASKIRDIHALATKVHGLLTRTLHELVMERRQAAG